MKEVDARGLSCPEPIMLTAEALKGANEPVKVLVSEPHQKTNVEKLAKDRGKATLRQKRLRPDLRLSLNNPYNKWAIKQQKDCRT